MAASTPSQQAALDIAARAAEAMVAQAAPIRLAVARSRAEKVKVYRLRCQVLIEEGWAQPSDFPEGMERDAYDEKAILIAGWAGEELAGTARIVLPMPEARLPTEEIFDLIVEPRGRVADWGRLAVARRYREPQARLFIALLGACWLEIRAHGVQEMCATTRPALIRLCRSRGIYLKRLGAAKIHVGEPRCPIQFDVAESAPWLKQHWLECGKVAEPIMSYSK